MKFLSKTNSIRVLKEADKMGIKKLLGKSHRRGTESILQNAFIKCASDTSLVRTNVRGSELGISNISAGRDRSIVDAVWDNEHIIEFKVVRIPRLIKLSPNSSLYDVGQILSDLARSLTTKKCKSATSYILIYGDLIRELDSEKVIAREVHNRLFTDYTTSLINGELHKEKKKPGRKTQMKVASLLNLDKPYFQQTSPVKVYRHNDIAIATISIHRDR